MYDCQKNITHIVIIFRWHAINFTRFVNVALDLKFQFSEALQFMVNVTKRVGILALCRCRLLNYLPNGFEYKLLTHDDNIIKREKNVGGFALGGEVNLNTTIIALT